MSIADNLNRIKKAKSDIKTAIEKKGVNVGNITIDKYAEKINLIEQGGGSGEKMKIKEGICLSGSTFTSFDGSEWDWSYVHDCSYMFQGCENMISAPTGLNMKPYAMKGMFYSCDNLIDLSGLADLDTSEVKSFSSLFYTCPSIINLNGLEQWNVSNVTNMDEMFNNCEALADISALSNWDTSNVTSMTNMFRECYKLTDISALSNWDTSNVTSMTNMFRYCNSLTSIILPKWDTSKLSSTNGLFYVCEHLTSVDMSNWDLSNVTDMSYMFFHCGNLDYLKMGGPIKSTVNVQSFLTDSNAGTFYYPKEYDYTKIINALPSSWTAVAY